VSSKPADWTRTQVLETVARAFPTEDASTVMAILDTYGTDSSERGRARVQLAILALSRGDLGELRKLVADAKRDYRDVLYWTELANGRRDRFADRLLEAMLTPALNPTRLALLTETVPDLCRVAVLAIRGYPPHRSQLAELEAKAGELRLTLHPIDVARAAGLASAFAAMRDARAEALIVLSATMLQFQLQEVAQQALAGRLPAISELPEFPRVGGLMSYGPSAPTMRRRAGASMDALVRRLKRQEPSEGTPEPASGPELVLNLRTARALALTIPPSVLERAAEVLA
jgi:ABC transporter substrate binding protein